MDHTFESFNEIEYLDGDIDINTPESIAADAHAVREISDILRRLTKDAAQPLYKIATGAEYTNDNMEIAVKHLERANSRMKSARALQLGTLAVIGGVVFGIPLGTLLGAGIFTAIGIQFSLACIVSSGALGGTVGGSVGGVGSYFSSKISY
tara:strand:+ start:341 stop:793 length:453 start_codon:yes stop_codon:yes gene_type:complete